jgi:hypothetical protein
MKFFCAAGEHNVDLSEMWYDLSDCTDCTSVKEYNDCKYGQEDNELNSDDEKKQVEHEKNPSNKYYPHDPAVSDSESSD